METAFAAGAIPSVDDSAAEIGELYRRARASVVESVRCLIEAGERLRAQKAKLPHGAWLPWLANNADVLGFESPSTASRLMRASKMCAGAQYDEARALDICRRIWGHAPGLDDDAIIRESLTIRRERYKAKYDARIKKLMDISAGNTAMPTQKRFPIILADPAWDFDQGDCITENYLPDNHYPTMTIDEIAALPVSELATDAAVLFLWTTAAHLREAVRVMEEAWGFTYRSHAMWDKQDIPRLGYWFRNQHEVLLVGARGDMPSPLPRNRPPSIIRSPRRKHSQKPDDVYELIERMYPEDLPKIELFARTQRPGWDSWGNQAKVSDIR